MKVVIAAEAAIVNATEVLIAPVVAATVTVVTDNSRILIDLIKIFKTM